LKAAIAQADPMGPDIEDGGKGWVLIDDSGPLLIWSVGVLLLSYTTPGDVAWVVFSAASPPNLSNTQTWLCRTLALALRLLAIHFLCRYNRLLQEELPNNNMHPTRRKGFGW
jgi:hypothetical protein